VQPAPELSITSAFDVHALVNAKADKIQRLFHCVLFLFLAVVEALLLRYKMEDD
jgi:hypothetical protein